MYRMYRHACSDVHWYLAASHPSSRLHHEVAGLSLRGRKDSTERDRRTAPIRARPDFSTVHSAMHHTKLSVRCKPQPHCPAPRTDPLPGPFICASKYLVPPATGGPSESTLLPRRGIHARTAHFKTHTRGKTRRGDETTTLKSILVHYQHAGPERFSRPPAERPENQPERPDVYYLHSPQLVTSSPVCRIDQTKPNPSSPFHRWTTCPRSLRRKLALAFSSEQTSPFRHRLTSSRPQNLPPSPQGRTSTRG
jgi:hypothetical protein